MNAMQDDGSAESPVRMSFILTGGCLAQMWTSESKPGRPLSAHHSCWDHHEHAAERR